LLLLSLRLAPTLLLLNCDRLIMSEGVTAAAAASGLAFGSSSSDRLGRRRGTDAAAAAEAPAGPGRQVRAGPGVNCPAPPACKESGVHVLLLVASPGTPLLLLP
jgi:hypothetical protein